MKKIVVFLVVLGALLGIQTAAASPLEKSCIDLGNAPYGDASPELAWRKLGLNVDQIKQVREQTPRKIMIDERFPLAKMIFKDGKLLTNVRVCGSEKADLYIINAVGGGKLVLIRPDKCKNWSILAGGVTLRFRTVTPAPVLPPLVLSPPVSPPAVGVPLAAPVATPRFPLVATPVIPRVPVKVGEKSTAGSLDASGAIYGTSSKTSRNSGDYGEIMYWFPPDSSGQSIGIGLIGSESTGYSLTSKSAWDIDFLGVEGGVKGGKSFTTKDGRTEQERWQVKGRLGVEHLEGVGSKGLPDKDQKTVLGGVYIEDLKTDGKCLYGWTGEAWLPLGSSTKNGKPIEDRTSAGANVLRECPIDEHLSWRISAGLGWSAVSGGVINTGAQLRYRTDGGVLFFIGLHPGIMVDGGALIWRGVIGAQVGGIDVGLLHNKYVEDHKVEATGRTGAEVFAPAAAEQPLQQ